MNLHRWVFPALLAVIAALFVAPLLAASVAVDATSYTLVAWTVAPGGHSQGGAFTLDGTAGQKDAGTMTGGPFVLSGGYWQSAVNTDSLFLAMIRK